MKKSNKFNPLFALGAVLVLVLGLFSGAMLFPKTIVEEKIVEVIQEPEIINETVIKTEYIERPYLDSAISEFLKYVEDEDSILGDYDFDSISVRRIYDEYSVSFDEDEYAVEAKVSLKFKEEDLSTKTEVYEFKVTFEDGEKPEVEIL